MQGVRLLVVVLLVAVAAMLGATWASAASSVCQVTNGHTAETYTRLQRAVDAAKPGAHLIVEGTCHGGTFIDKDTAIRGVGTRGIEKPTLDGDAKARVLTIKPGVKVSVRNLVIRDGRATRIPDGGGISNKGGLTLRDVVVRSSHATGRGGGIYNEGTLHILGASLIRGNAAATGTGPHNSTGPGVYNAGRLVMGDSARIRDNDCSGLHNVGKVVMLDTSDIGGNSLGWPFCARGNSNQGSLVMNDSSSISGEYGGMVNSGTFTMNDTSSIHANWGRAGVRNSGTFTMNDHSSIHHIRGDAFPRIVGDGGEGGVANAGTFIMNDKSSVHHNTGDGRGGGVWNGPAASFTMTGSSRVHDNEVADRTHGHGGGLYNSSGGRVIGIDCGVSVNHNAPDDCFFEP